MSRPRAEPTSGAMTALAWVVCLAVSWLTMQTVDLAFRVLQ